MGSRLISRRSRLSSSIRSESPRVLRRLARATPSTRRSRPPRIDGEESPPVTLPSLFISHGSPMHAVAPGDAGRAWGALGRRLKPRAVVVASAHWETAVPMVTVNAKPRTIHDFGGFPQELYEIQYAASGDPALAQRIVSLLKDAGIAAGVDGCRGLDHGAWVPLR